MRVKKVYVGYCTHLAVNWGCPAEINQDMDYDCEAGQARSRVNLPKRYNWPETMETQSKALSLRTHIVHRYR